MNYLAEDTHIIKDLLENPFNRRSITEKKCLVATRTKESKSILRRSKSYSPSPRPLKIPILPIFSGEIYPLKGGGIANVPAKKKDLPLGTMAAFWNEFLFTSNSIFQSPQNLVK